MSMQNATYFSGSRRRRSRRGVGRSKVVVMAGYRPRRRGRSRRPGIFGSFETSHLTKLANFYAAFLRIIERQTGKKAPALITLLGGLLLESDGLISEAYADIGESVISGQPIVNAIFGTTGGAAPMTPAMAALPRVMRMNGLNESFMGLNESFSGLNVATDYGAMGGRGSDYPVDG